MDASVKQTVLVVFAGGPHTGSRLARAVELVRSEPPASVFLTGHEFHDPQYALAIQVLSGLTHVVLDGARRTVQSCRVLARQIEPSSTVHVITSNYHALRVRWLLQPLLPRDATVDVETTPDIQAAELLHSSLARKLILGEILSWLYCFPLGLLHAGLRR